MITQAIIAFSELDKLINTFIKTHPSIKQIKNENYYSFFDYCSYVTVMNYQQAMLIEQQSEETAGFKTMVKDELEEHLREIRKALILKESLIQQAEFEK